MEPERNRSTRSHQRQNIVYDMKNPSNWTVAKLWEELGKLNIKAPVNCRKTELMRLYNVSMENAGRQREQRCHTQRQENETEVPVINNNGGELSVILQELGRLREEVNDLRQSHIQHSIPAAAGSTNQLQQQEVLHSGISGKHWQRLMMHWKGQQTEGTSIRLGPGTDSARNLCLSSRRFHQKSGNPSLKVRT